MPPRNLHFGPEVTRHRDDSFLNDSRKKYQTEKKKRGSLDDYEPARSAVNSDLVMRARLEDEGSSKDGFDKRQYSSLHLTRHEYIRQFQKNSDRGEI